MAFNDLDEVYDKVPIEVSWWRLIKKRVHIKYTNIIKDKYDGIVTNVIISDSLISKTLIRN